MITKVNHKKIIFSLVYKVFNLFYSYISEKFNPIIVMTEEGVTHWRRYNIQHSKYMAIVATQTEAEPENLPPTVRATYYHALRVHLQVTQ